MLLTISTTHRPATDLGFLLHKNPAGRHTAELSGGAAHVFYPEADEERCTAAVLVDMDPVALVRDHRGSSGGAFALGQYVNDRPYALSSLMSVALGRLFGTAMSGRSKERPELAEQPIPVEVSLPVAPCRGGAAVARRLFEPLGYTVDAVALPLDPAFPEWGSSRYLSLRLTATARIRDVIGQLYVLLPVLDDDKHYWVGQDEIGKLLRRGEGWLAGHPDRELIAHRYLRHDRRLTRDALARLAEEDGGDPDRRDEENDAQEEAAERRIGLHDLRLATVTEVIQASGSRRVLDLGCGSGKLIAQLLKVRGIEQVTGVDVSQRALAGAAQRLHLDSMAPRQRARVELLHGSLGYRDRRLEGFDAAAAVEVIEHLDPSRLPAFERAVFGAARPGLVVLTTPNVEFNPLMTALPAGAFRHADHRFEWTRAQFAEWAAGVAERNGYSVELSGIGPPGAGPGGADLGTATQLAVFRR